MEQRIKTCMDGYCNRMQSVKYHKWHIGRVMSVPGRRDVSLGLGEVVMTQGLGSERCLGFQ